MDQGGLTIARLHLLNYMAVGLDNPNTGHDFGVDADLLLLHTTLQVYWDRLSNHGASLRLFYPTLPRLRRCGRCPGTQLEGADDEEDTEDHTVDPNQPENRQ